MVGRNPGLSAIIEIVGGFFGILGLGHIYNGYFNRGIFFLFGYWIFIAIEIAVYLIFAIATFGIGAICLFPIFLINLFIIIFSAKIAFDET